MTTALVAYGTLFRVEAEANTNLTWVLERKWGIDTVIHIYKQTGSVLTSSCSGL